MEVAAELLPRVGAVGVTVHEDEVVGEVLPPTALSEAVGVGVVEGVSSTVAVGVGVVVGVVEGVSPTVAVAVGGSVPVGLTLPLGTSVGDSVGVGEPVAVGVREGEGVGVGNAAPPKAAKAIWYVGVVDHTPEPPLVCTKCVTPEKVAEGSSTTYPAAGTGTAQSKGEAGRFMSEVTTSQILVKGGNVVVLKVADSFVEEA